ncbi:hypothetical protein G6F64_014095 [Rhizopus arrhizus]|uniref:Uncharacterized protein n=1 Tax=Rhizopus oryzae TaxID=64495 RepID=A0A9P6WU79_RHIOR|nr:hypothetical protein G6F64_014095 [Rhizopus arrhizus]
MLKLPVISTPVRRRAALAAGSLPPSSCLRWPCARRPGRAVPATTALHPHRRRRRATGCQGRSRWPARPPPPNPPTPAGSRCAGCSAQVSSAPSCPSAGAAGAGAAAAGDGCGGTTGSAAGAGVAASVAAPGNR